MSLKARLKRLEAAAKWLRYEGHVLLYERQYEVLALRQRYDRAVERKERMDALAAERARSLAEAEARQEAVYAAQCAGSPAPPAVSQPQITAVALSPGPEPPPLPPEAQDIPEHMQIRPVHWRFRGPDDWDDEDVPSVLHEYDPLAEFDSS